MNLKERLRKNEKTVGAWLTVGHPQVAEAMCSTGLYDWLAVDIEHSTPTIDQAAAIFLACEKFAVTPLIRSLGHDPFTMRRFLDAGAHGIIIPVVNNISELEKITEHLQYAPKGRRGVCLSRMNNWGDQFNEYYNNFDPIIIPQIESTEGVSNIESILSHESVDGVFVGPYDLSGSAGCPGEFDTAVMKDLLTQVKEKTLKSGKALGLHVVDPNPNDLAAKLKEGYNFIAFGTDMVCMRAPLKSAHEQIEQLKTR